MPTKQSMRIETVTEERISLWTELGSCAELDKIAPGIVESLGCKLTEPIFWFCRLKAKVERQGEGTKLMKRLVQILDERKITVVNGPNAYGSMSLEQLKIFYRKYGFKDVDEGIMVRYPNE